MSDVRFKDVVIDAHKPELVGAWWGKLIGAKVSDADDNDEVRIDSDPVIRVNKVSDPLGTSRVKLEVRVKDAKRSTETDPEGLEWLRFPSSETRVFGLLVDAQDPAALARWWADRTGATFKERGPYVFVEDVPGLPWDVWAFTVQKGPKTVKNRMHWDVTLADTTVSGLVALGAVLLEEHPTWTVMADPEGNEFCAFST
jgi:hypothetical protein